MRVSKVHADFSVQNRPVVFQEAIVEVTSLPDLAFLTSQHTWGPVFDGLGLCKENFVETQVWALDIDNKDCKLDDAQVTRRCLASGLKFIASHSKSHMKEKVSGKKVHPPAPRYRLLFVSEKPCRSSNDFEATYTELLKNWPEADKLCRASNHWFSPSQVFKVHNYGAFLPVVQGTGFPVYVSTKQEGSTDTFDKAGTDECTCQPEVMKKAIELMNFLAKNKPSIQGEGGSGRLMEVCHVLLDFSLCMKHSLVILDRRYNVKAAPPWSPFQLKRKLQDASRDRSRHVHGKYVKRSSDPRWNVDPVLKQLKQDMDSSLPEFFTKEHFDELWDAVMTDRLIAKSLKKPLCVKLRSDRRRYKGEVRRYTSQKRNWANRLEQLFNNGTGFPVYVSTKQEGSTDTFDKAGTFTLEDLAEALHVELTTSTKQNIGSAMKLLAQENPDFAWTYDKKKKAFKHMKTIVVRQHNYSCEASQEDRRSPSLQELEPVRLPGGSRRLRVEPNSVAEADWEHVVLDPRDRVHLDDVTATEVETLTTS